MNPNASSTRAEENGPLLKRTWRWPIGSYFLGSAWNETFMGHMGHAPEKRRYQIVAALGRQLTWRNPGYRGEDA